MSWDRPPQSLRDRGGGAGKGRLWPGTDGPQVSAYTQWPIVMEQRARKLMVRQQLLPRVEELGLELG